MARAEERQECGPAAAPPDALFRHTPPPTPQKPKSSRSEDGKQFFYGPSRSFRGQVFKPSWGERQLKGGAARC